MTIEIHDGNPLTRHADGSMCRSSIAELVQELGRLRQENKTLHTLAKNAEPGPISKALAATLHVATWRQRAAHWLRDVAAQELTDAAYTGNTGVSAKERAAFLNALADQVERA